jgi:hypothetical protein
MERIESSMLESKDLELNWFKTLKPRKCYSTYKVIRKEHITKWKIINHEITKILNKISDNFCQLNLTLDTWGNIDLK